MNIYNRHKASMCRVLSVVRVMICTNNNLLNTLLGIRGSWPYIGYSIFTEVYSGTWTLSGLLVNQTMEMTALLE